jgi:hypothetical protein
MFKIAVASALVSYTGDPTGNVGSRPRWPVTAGSRKGLITLLVTSRACQP